MASPVSTSATAAVFDRRLSLKLRSFCESSFVNDWDFTDGTARANQSPAGRAGRAGRSGRFTLVAPLRAVLLAPGHAAPHVE